MCVFWIFLSCRAGFTQASSCPWILFNEFHVCCNRAARWVFLKLCAWKSHMRIPDNVCVCIFSNCIGGFHYAHENDMWGIWRPCVCWIFLNCSAGFTQASSTHQMSQEFTCASCMLPGIMQGWPQLSHVHQIVTCCPYCAHGFSLKTHVLKTIVSLNWGCVMLEGRM